MNFLSIRYFLAVNRERNFTRAAESLYITQQTLSAHIAALEKELGTPLFERTTPLTLTYAGQSFANYAIRFERLSTSLQEEFNDLRNHQRGLLRVGIATTRAKVLMPDIMVLFRQKHPEVEVHLVEAVNADLPKVLLERDVDLIIGQPTYESSQIEYEDFYGEETVAVLPYQILENTYKDKADNVLQQLQTSFNLALLRDCPYLLNNQGDTARKVSTRLFSQAGFEPQTCAQCDNIEILLEMCYKGLGICFCSDFFLKNELGSEKLSKMHIFRLGSQAQYRICFGLLRGVYRSTMLNSFIQSAWQTEPWRKKADKLTPSSALA